LKKHIDALYKLVHSTTFNKSVQSLLFLHHIYRAQRRIDPRFYRALYTRLLTDDIPPVKTAIFLNLVYKALKVDPNIVRIMAFMKRLLQIALHQPPNFIGAVLFIVSEMIKIQPQILKMISEPLHTDQALIDIQPQGEGEEVTSSSYDPLKRQPEFAAANKSCLWELNLLAGHFNPAIARFSQSLLMQRQIKFDGDPLVQFTTIAFLERFVGKNPKQKIVERTKPGQRPAIPFHPKSYLGRPESQITDVEVFLYKYFANRGQKQKKKKKDKKKARKTMMMEN